MSSSTMKVQAQIRQNATEVSNYLTDLQKWEKSMKVTDKKITAKKAGVRGKALPVRAGVGTVSTVSTASGVSTASVVKTVVKESEKTQEAEGKAGSAAKHTYDIGYKKWENIDVDALLDAQEEEDQQQSQSEPEPEPVSSSSVSEQEQLPPAPTTLLTPATIVDMGRTASKDTVAAAAVPKARGQFNNVDAETAERERGNMEFKKGNFAAAAKSYTRCLGLKAKNYVAFSNRAMAYLKLKDFLRAEADCTCALSIQPGHVKSLVRRATARSQQGKLRAAMEDLLAATEAEGNTPSKSVAVDLSKTRELLKNAVSRAPLHRLAASRVQWEEEAGVNVHDGGHGAASMLEGPEVPVYSEMPEGAVRVAITSADDVDDGDYEGLFAAAADEPPVGTKVVIEWDDDDDEEDVIAGGGNDEHVHHTQEQQKHDMKKEATVKKAASVAAASGKKEKSPDKKKKKMQKDRNNASIKSAYELQRCLNTLKGTRESKTNKSLEEFFSKTFRPSDLQKLLPAMMEADILHELFVLLEVHVSGSTKLSDADRVLAVEKWMAVLLGSSQNLKGAVDLLLRLLSAVQRAHLKGMADKYLALASTSAGVSAGDEPKCASTFAGVIKLLE